MMLADMGYNEKTDGYIILLMGCSSSSRKTEIKNDVKKYMTEHLKRRLKDRNYRYRISLNDIFADSHADSDHAKEIRDYLRVQFKKKPYKISIHERSHTDFVLKFTYQYSDSDTDTHT